MDPRTTRTHRPDTGFTLVELLISIGLSGIIVVATLGVMVANHRAYQIEEEQSYIQQTTRALVDILTSDLERAGLGMPHPEDQEDEPGMIFRAGSQAENNNNAPDTLVFAASDGAVAFMTHTGTVSISTGGSQTFAVEPGSLPSFTTGVNGKANQVALYNLDREYAGKGLVSSIDNASGQITVSSIETPDAATISLEPYSYIVQFPYYVTYTISDIEGVPTLVRCWSDTHGDQCHPPATPPASADSGWEVVAENVEDIQVSVMLEAANAWDPNFDLANASLDDRKLINAIKVDVLMRGWSSRTDYQDTKTYHMGNRVYEPEDLGGEAQHYTRQQMSVIVRLQNAM